MAKLEEKVFSKFDVNIASPGPMALKALQTPNVLTMWVNILKAETKHRTSEMG